MPLRLFDTHAHLGDARFDTDRPAVLARARAAGVERLIEASSDLPSSEAACALAGRYREQTDPAAPAIWCTIGIHPHEADTADDAAMQSLAHLLEGPHADRIVAIGEIGLDYHYDFSPRPRQREAMSRQLALAARAGLPVVIHEREAPADCMAVLRDFGVAPGKTAGLGGIRGIPGAFHCFSGSVETAEELVAMGFFLGFDGPITFKNARKAPDVIRKIPRDRVLIETDSPYLTPVPYRGQRNEPAYVLQVVLQLAVLWECTPEEAAQCTWENACRFFGIPPHRPG